MWLGDLVYNLDVEFKISSVYILSPASLYLLPNITQILPVGLYTLTALY